MKHEIFISYCDADKDKVDLIVEELRSNAKFTPLVIASNREALKPLAKKVADGIIKAKVIVPILTKNSIATQWINQEIGFATAIGKTIKPIIDKDLIGSLKGFIHKEIDLPYNYQSGSNKAKEHKNFIKHFRNLLSDLENELGDKTIPEPQSTKSDFEKSLEEVDIANAEVEFQNQRKRFLNSSDGLAAAKSDVLGLFDEIQGKIKKLEEKSFRFGMEKEIYEPLLILQSEGYSFSLAWEQKYGNTTEGLILRVRFWERHVTNKQNVHYFPGEEPKLLQNTEYTFDCDRNLQSCWLNQTDKKQYSSTKIADSCLAWITGQVINKRLGK